MYDAAWTVNTAVFIAAAERPIFWTESRFFFSLRIRFPLVSGGSKSCENSPEPCAPDTPTTAPCNTLLLDMECVRMSPIFATHRLFPTDLGPFVAKHGAPDPRRGIAAAANARVRPYVAARWAVRIPLARLFEFGPSFELETDLRPFLICAPLLALEAHRACLHDVPVESPAPASRFTTVFHGVHRSASRGSNVWVGIGLVEAGSRHRPPGNIVCCLPSGAL